ncbi:hypothetical protein G647_08832 [Cladophialophora carrionii CBS 160.54]|uniref:Uncharacterized protein n=1 Tax=Cladophialophora carrionii CBS 160.54 TaxID=1279043 RepID=V9D0J5_9EURO|nr:uncharacterized protein G647_08832 [Cladophialophora carrionii CBS 160.54]ETI19818.1 hypothetical protein G647_08832 [Cladophialophora carrionii CBS 160.54]
MSFHQLRRSALPILTALIGCGGLIIGIWSFVSPSSAANAFGGYMVRVLQAQAQSSPTHEGTQMSNGTPSSFAYDVKCVSFSARSSQGPLIHLIGRLSPELQEAQHDDGLLQGDVESVQAHDAWRATAVGSSAQASTSACEIGQPYRKSRWRWRREGLTGLLRTEETGKGHRGWLLWSQND